MLMVKLVVYFTSGDDTSTGDSAPTGDVAPDTGSSGAGVGGSGGSDFSWDSWDGTSDSIPEDNRAAYDAIQQNFNKSKTSEVSQALVNNLRARHERQRRDSDNARSAMQKSNAGEEPKNLTQEDFNRQMNRREQETRMRGRTDKFRRDMESLIGSPQQFGDTTIAFSDQGDVDAFENFMRDKFSNGISPREMLTIFKIDSILKGHRNAAIRSQEKTLRDRKGSMRDGSHIDKNRQAPEDRPEIGDGGRVSSIEEYIKAHNPDAARAIASGEINVLENL